MRTWFNRDFLSLAIAVLFITPSAFCEVTRIEEGNLVLENIPEIPADVIERMRQYQNVRSAVFQDWMPNDQGILISTRFGETYQLHSVSGPEKARQQITFFDEPIGSAKVCPDSRQNTLLFTKDVGGGEMYQIFSYDLGNATYKMLTDGVSRNGAILWSNRGANFAFYSTKRNNRDFDIYTSSIDRPDEAQLILQVSGMWNPLDWSPDDKSLLVGEYISINESHLFTFNIANRSLEQINPSDEKISYGDAAWSKDGKGIYYASDEDSEFLRLRYYDLASKNSTVLTEDIPWDVESISLSKDGSHLAFMVNENGMSKLYLLDTSTKKYHKVPGIPVGQVTRVDFHPDGDRIAIIINTPQSPSDVYMLDLKDMSLERWTYSEIGGLDSGSFIVPELIEYETFDEVDGHARKIPAFYFKPDKGDEPFPVLISIHGGPEGQYQPYFNPSIQYYLKEMGIAVLAPNVRGSSGYGKSYLKLDNGFKREDSVKDIGALLDWIEKQPELDPERVVVYGGSYGGYMVLASMARYNDRLRAGIDIVGISNFVTFLTNTKEYRRDLRRVEYGDERDPAMREFLEKISPTTIAHKISKPLFIAQGLNDPRVPASEAEQMVEVIRNNGGDVWYMLAKDEGHGFRKKSNRDTFNHAMVLFLQEFLLK